MPAVVDDAVIDRQAFMQRIGDDAQLAQTLVGVLLGSLPELSAAVAEAVAGGQATALERSAHALRGALSTFSASRAIEAARKLESMGREGALGGCAAAHSDLQAELVALETFLRADFGQERA